MLLNKESALWKVCEGDIVFIEKLDVNEGDTVTFDRVKAVSAGAELRRYLLDEEQKNVNSVVAALNLINPF